MKLAVPVIGFAVGFAVASTGMAWYLQVAILLPVVVALGLWWRRQDQRRPLEPDRIGPMRYPAPGRSEPPGSSED